MSKKKYTVKLSETQREKLIKLVSSGRAQARKIKRANVLLLADEGKTDQEILSAIKYSHYSIFLIRQRFALEGLEAALSEKKRPGKKKKLNQKQEAYLIALTCSQPPKGREVWTMQLLSDRLIELSIVDSISDETVRTYLKKTL